MKNSEAFLDAFAKIERHLRRLLGASSWIPFTQLVAKTARFSPEVRRYREDLKEFADLRNAIVHDRMNGDVIAEPNAWAVERIAAIARLLTEPPAVVPLFSKKVFTVRDDEPLARALQLMREGYSQLPVIASEGGRRFRTLLTAAAITRWLVESIDGGIVDTRATTVADVALHAERSYNYVFVAPSTSVFEVIEAFHEFEARGRKLHAVLITRDGRPSDVFVGVVTVADLPALFSQLGMREIEKGQTHQRAVQE